MFSAVAFRFSKVKFCRQLSVVFRLPNASSSSYSDVDRVYVYYLNLSNLVNFNGPTGEEVVKDVDLTGKTCLITGGNSGIGLEITRCLMSKNCNMLMAVRNMYAANIAVKNFNSLNGSCQFYEANLASLASVKKCTETLLREQKQIDLVILNAAVFGIPWTVTKDNLETIFQVNYLSQFYMLSEIEKILSKNARVVIVTSESHRNIKWSLQDKICPSESLLSLPEEEYTSIRAYNISKLCGILGMHYYAYRWINTEKSIFCAHPGSFIKTNLCANWWPFEALYTMMMPFSKSVQQAASTPLYCATSPEIENYSGLYFKDCKQAAESDLARDNHLSFKVMEITKNMIIDRMGINEEVFIDTKRDKETIEKPVVESSQRSVEESLISNVSG